MGAMLSSIAAVAANASASRSTELLPLHTPAQTRGTDSGRTEPALLAMPLRNRQNDRSVSSSTPALEVEGVVSAATLTPTSRENTLQGNDSSTAWHAVAGRLTSLLSSESRENKAAAYDRKHGYDRIKHIKVEDLPVGFPQLAEILSNNDDWTIFRGFHSLHARVLAQLQVELTLLQEELLELDRQDEQLVDARYRLRTTGKEIEGRDTSQRDLLEKIKNKLTEYDDFLLKHAQIRALGRPPQRDYLSVFNWILTRRPLCDSYYDFIYYSDFVTASGCSERFSQSNWFQEAIRWCINCWPLTNLRGLLKSKAEVDKTSDPIVHHYSSVRLAVISKVLQVFFAVGVLLTPVFLLLLLPLTRPEMAGVLLAFVLFFAAMMSLATDAKTQEILIGTAAYAAVLVTFLGNLNGNMSLATNAEAG